MSDLQPTNILIYRAVDNRIRLEVKLEDKTIWLSQKQIGELYQKSKATISEHIKNIFQDGELDPEATVRKFRTVQKEGDRQVERLTEASNTGAGTLVTACPKCQIHFRCAKAAFELEIEIMDLFDIVANRIKP